MLGRAQAAEAGRGQRAWAFRAWRDTQVHPHFRFYGKQPLWEQRRCKCRKASFLLRGDHSLWEHGAWLQSRFPLKLSWEWNWAAEA